MNIERWCEYKMQASYTINIPLHRAINTTPYEAVFGITAHRENHQTPDENIKCKGEATELASGKNTLDNDQCETVERAAKRHKISERHCQYNEEMLKQTRQPRKEPFKIDDMWLQSKLVWSVSRLLAQTRQRSAGLGEETAQWHFRLQSK